MDVAKGCLKAPAETPSLAGAVTITLFKQGSQLAAGRYVLEHRLGSGGMATVWLAQDTRLARRVAIKMPSEALSADESFAIRFEREAQTAAALSHPNLVSVYDYGSEDGHPFLVSEYIDGSNLAELRARGEEPSTERLARALLDALAHIHAAGIVHRDVKPGNVLVDRAGRILLTDFGIAQSSGSPTLTAEGHVVGTPSYLAPEIKRGGRADARSDLYAVGVLLGEQLSGRDPDRVVRLVDALTETDPAARPVDAAQALELIERRPVVVSTEETPVEEEPEEPTSVREIVTPPPPPRQTGSFPLPPPSEPQRERPLGMIAGGLVGILLVAVLAFAILGGGGDDSGDTQASTAAKKSGDKGSGGGSEVPQAEPATTTVTEQSTTTVQSDATQADTSGPSGLPTPIEPPDPAQGSDLNAQGYQLLQSGDPASALPILEKAVASWPADSSDVEYGYALFNYAQALRLTGNPEAAIPVLKRRMQIPDQLEAVRAELAAAKQAAGG
jgi:serine/threonine-protein kinase